MTVIDLSNPLKLDPRPYLRALYPKESRKILNLDFAAWDDLLDAANSQTKYVLFKGGWENKRSGIRPPALAVSYRVGLINSSNNIVMWVNPNEFVGFNTGNQSYYALGPFIVFAELKKFNIPSSENGSPVESVNGSGEHKDLEYLEI